MPIMALLAAASMLGFHSGGTFRPITQDPTRASLHGGIPIRFDGGGEGELTSDIVLGHAGDVAALLAPLDGVIQAKRSALIEDMWVVSFRSPMLALAGANLLYRSGQVQYAHPDFVIAKDFRS